jgi:ppGpp synthetase/RelA/SpoT-type nucleotidyltranferase
MKKPKTIEEFKEWARDEIDCDFDDEANANLYDTNCNRTIAAAQNHPFFRDLDNKLLEWEDQYRLKTGTSLLMSGENIDLTIKTFESVLNKSFRFNVIWNKKFPKEPEKGWVGCDNAFGRLNDIIRGTLVCRFIDGPAFLVKNLDTFAKELGLTTYHYPQNRDVGYYAYHFYVRIPVALLHRDLIVHDDQMDIEIQITTQLQEVLKDMTHGFYRTERLQPSNDDKWKWEFGTNKFKVGYLGHALHLLESVILEARDFNRKRSQAKKRGDKNA